MLQAAGRLQHVLLQLAGLSISAIQATLACFINI